MPTELTKDAAASASGGGQGRAGRVLRSLGARVIGLLLLALGLGLSHEGVTSGIYEPFTASKPGKITVERCSQETGRSPTKCEGEFVSDDGKTKDTLFARVETGEPYPKGHRIDVVRVGEFSYATSFAAAVAEGLRYLFGGLCALGPALFCLIAGRWPGPRAAGVLRSMHPAFSWITFPMVGVGIVGLIVAGIVHGAG